MKSRWMKWACMVLACVLATFMLTGCSGKRQLTGCSGKRQPANEVANALYELYILGNSAKAKALGFSDEEIKKLEEAQEKSSIDIITANFKANGLTIAEEDARKIYEAQMGAYKKLTYSSKVTKEEGDSAEITLTTKSMDLVQADIDVLNRMGGQITEDLKAAYIENLIAELGKLEPSAEEQTVTAQFSFQTVTIGGKTKNMWNFVNAEEFHRTLGNAVQGL